MFQLTDTHVHLHFSDYDEDRGAVIERSREAGIGRFLNVGTDVESSEKAVKLAQSQAFIWGAAGIHPHDVKNTDEEDLLAIERLLREAKVVAIGEVGLDFFRDLSPRPQQKKILNRFFELYRKTKKPLVLHIRDAYKEMEEQVKGELKPPVAGVVHCFSGEKETMKRFLDLGFHISFAGPLTYKKNDALREAFKACPADRLLLETDAPFLPPQSQRGKRNESAFLLETARLGAELRKVPVEALAEMTTENANRLFRLETGP